MDISRFRRIYFILFLYFFSLTACYGTIKTDSTVLIPLRGTRVHKKILSLKDLRDKNVIKQGYDYSCGSSALATLLNFYFGEKISEKEIIDLIFKDRTESETEKIMKEGFSLLNLKEIAEKLGYFGIACRLKLKHLRKLRAPVIVFIEPGGYKHFAVLKGVKGDRVYLADPSRGNIRMSIYHFKNQWQGITLAIDKEGPVSLSTFLDIAPGTQTCPEILNTRRLFPIDYIR